jgi:hypothetical protein
MIKSRKMRWEGNIEHMGGKRNTCKILLVKRSLGKPRRRWADFNKVDLRLDGVVWTGFTERYP